MNKAIIAAMMLLVCIGCGTHKMAMTTDVQKDSVSVVIKESVIYRDTTIYVEVPVEVIKEVVPDTDTSHIETSLAVSEAWVKAGQLNHTLKHKESAKIAKNVPMPEKHTQKDSVVTEFREVIKEVPVMVEKELTSWQTFRMTMGTLLLIALAGWLLLKAVKRFLLK